MQGQKVCFTLKPPQGPENVPELASWGTSLGAGKGAGEATAQLWLCCPCHGSGWGCIKGPLSEDGASPTLAGRRPWLVWLPQVLRTLCRRPLAFWRHGLEICQTEPGRCGLLGWRLLRPCSCFLQHCPLPVFRRPTPWKCCCQGSTDEHLAAPVRLL